MITNAILFVLLKVLYLVLTPIRLLPDITLPASVSNAISTVSQYLSSVNTLIPIDQLLTILGALLSIEALILTYKIIMWVVKKIPTLN